MITISNALLELTPEAQWSITDNDYDTIVWHTPGIPKPSKAAVNAQVALMEANEPLEATKAEAKRLIAASDWSVLPDVGLQNQADFVAYRTILRNFIKVPVTNPSWPTEPEPIWS